VSAGEGLKSLRGLPEGFAQEKLSSAPAHPGSKSYLGVTMTETMVHSVNGKVATTASGKFACDYGGLSAPIYLRASWRGTVKLATPRPSGATSLETIWIGWNNLLTNRVDRYLIVKELDGTGARIKEQCTTYPDVNPEGYKDPLPLMAERYKLAKSSANFSEYEYQWTLRSGAQMLSTMVSDANGFPPKSVAITSTTRDGHESAYNFSYMAPVHEVDPSIFYEYKKYDCTTVSNFTTSDVCVDPWLVMQYECEFTEGMKAELSI
jgi:hypothetical protein